MLNDIKMQELDKLVERHKVLNAYYSALEEREAKVKQKTNITEEERSFAIRQLEKEYEQAALEMKAIAERAQILMKEIECEE